MSITTISTIKDGQPVRPNSSSISHGEIVLGTADGFEDIYWRNSAKEVVALRDTYLAKSDADLSNRLFDLVQAWLSSPVCGIIYNASGLADFSTPRCIFSDSLNGGDDAEVLLYGTCKMIKSDGTTLVADKSTKKWRAATTEELGITMLDTDNPTAMYLILNTISSRWTQVTFMGGCNTAGSNVLIRSQVVTLSESQLNLLFENYTRDALTWGSYPLLPSLNDKINKVKSDAADTYLTKSDAADTYLTKSDAIDTYLEKSDAEIRRNSFLSNSTISVRCLNTAMDGTANGIRYMNAEGETVDCVTAFSIPGSIVGDAEAHYGSYQAIGNDDYDGSAACHYNELPNVRFNFGGGNYYMSIDRWGEKWVKDSDTENKAGILFTMPNESFVHSTLGVAATFYGAFGDAKKTVSLNLTANQLRNIVKLGVDMLKDFYGENNGALPTVGETVSTAVDISNTSSVPTGTTNPLSPLVLFVDMVDPELGIVPSNMVITRHEREPMGEGVVAQTPHSIYINLPSMAALKATARYRERFNATQWFVPKEGATSMEGATSGTIHSERPFVFESTLIVHSDVDGDSKFILNENDDVKLATTLPNNAIGADTPYRLLFYSTDGVSAKVKVV